MRDAHPVSSSSPATGDPPPARPAAHRRSDAHRNHEAILSAAIAVLVDEPTASMREVASASGIGRTTLYRHFPDRESLIAASYERVLDEAEALTERLLDAAGADPLDSLTELAVALAGLGDRYRFLAQRDAAAPAEDPEQVRSRGTRLRAYLAEAQRAGHITAQLDVEWLFDVLVGLITQASRSPASPPVRDAQLARTVRRVVAP
jgi:AcrR family transcriptional regulator